MVGAVSGYNSYMSYGYFPAASYRNQMQQPAPTAQAAQTPAHVTVAQRRASPETPVQPVDPVTPVKVEAASTGNLGLTFDPMSDPAEVAVRMRIQYLFPDAKPAGAQAQEAAAAKLPGVDSEVSGAESAQKIAEEGRCETCESRKYQDGSDDPGVSFKTASHIDPDVAASVVRGHEQEHVVREQAEARREGREVVRQSVTLHTDICPECGRVYVSGGTTRTTTAEKQSPEQQQQEQQKNAPAAVA